MFLPIDFWELINSTLIINYVKFKISAEKEPGEGSMHTFKHAHTACIHVFMHPVLAGTCVAICPEHTEPTLQVHPFPETAVYCPVSLYTHTHTHQGLERMPVLVFFLSHVDDSHDKVLKLAPLTQLPSKVNVNLEGSLSMRHRDKWLEGVLCGVEMCAYLCQRALHVRRYLYTCLRTLVWTCMHGECGNMMCGYERGMNPWQLCVFDEGFHLTSRRRTGPLTTPFPRALPGYQASVCLTLLLSHQPLTAYCCPGISQTPSKFTGPVQMPSSLHPLGDR